jgi:hypothetical protein
MHDACEAVELGIQGQIELTVMTRQEKEHQCVNGCAGSHSYADYDGEHDTHHCEASWPRSTTFTPMARCVDFAGIHCDRCGRLAGVRTLMEPQRLPSARFVPQHRSLPDRNDE